MVVVTATGDRYMKLLFSRFVSSEKKNRHHCTLQFTASAAGNKDINYFWQIASTLRTEKTCGLFAGERMRCVVKKLASKQPNSLKRLGIS